MRSVRLLVISGFCLLAVYTVWAQGGPVDPSATKETISLYKNLLKLQEKGFLLATRMTWPMGWNGNTKKEEVM